MEHLINQLRQNGTLTLSLSIRPSAQTTAWKSRLADGTWKISVAAPPEDGKANEALVRFLADYFDVPRSNVEVLSGQTGRRKTVRIVRALATKT
jgi:uncharacterized protein (TIGR00251 family)